VEELEESERSNIGRLLALAKPQWRILALGTVFLVLASVMALLYPQAVRIIINRLNQKTQTSWSIDFVAIAMLGIFVIQGVSVALRHYFFTLAGERIVAHLREALYHNIIFQEIAFFDRHRTGELLNRLSSDTTILQSAVSVNVSKVFRSGSLTLGGICFLFYTSPKLTLLSLLIVPPIAIGSKVFGRYVQKHSRIVQDALADAGEVAEETISGIRTVQTFSQEKKESQRYNQYIERAFDIAKKRAVIKGYFLAMITAVGYSTITLVFWYGARLAQSGQLTVGELTSFVMYTMIVGFSLNDLSQLWADFMQASGSTHRVFALVDRSPNMREESGEMLSSLKGEMTFEGVSFCYPTRPDVLVLDRLQLTLEAGKILAIVGPSGSGKSTVAALLMRLYDPQEGVVTLDGKDLKTLDVSWLRTQIGVVSQEPLLFSTSILENIQYGCENATQEEIKQAAIAANAHDFIMSFPEGYHTAVGERGVQLSGGQKQRIAIARALLKNPPILLLDEATSALDTESESVVKEALERLMKGRSTLVIAHRLSTVKDAHCVIVLEKGQLIQQGTHEELLSEGGIYRRLIEHQIFQP